MKPLVWRRYNQKVYLQELLPLAVRWLADMLETEVETYKLLPLSPTQKALGFSYENVVVCKFKLKKKDEVVLKIPKSDSFDLIRVSDVLRVFTMELGDGVVSVRSNAYPFTFAWSTNFGMIVWSNDGQTTVGNTVVWLAPLVNTVLTENERLKYGLVAEFVTARPVDTNNCLEVEGKGWLRLPAPFHKLTPFQQVFFVSWKKAQERDQTVVTPQVIQQIEDILDVVTSHTYNIKSVRDLLLLTCDRLAFVKLADLTGCNLRFRRIRLWDRVVAHLLRKFKEVVRTQRAQQDLRIPPEFLLKSMTTLPLVRNFEVCNLLNPFSELSLKLKLTTPLEWVPYELRSVHPSYSFNIDIYDTPDDEDVGSRLYVALEAEINERGEFIIT